VLRSNGKFRSDIYEWKNVVEIGTDNIINVTYIRFTNNKTMIRLYPGIFDDKGRGMKKILHDFIEYADKNNAKYKIDDEATKYLKSNKK